MDRPDDRIPHRAPWLLVDRVLHTAGDEVCAERRLTASDPLLADGLPEVLLVEALAQTAACLHGAERGPHRGYLVAASRFEFHGRAQAGDTVRLEARRRAAHGALVRFEGRALVGERLVAAGEMTFAVEGAS